MNNYYYTCDYCYKEYVPTRRGAQRFCKPSCRTTSHKKEKELQLQLAAPETQKKKKKKKDGFGKIDKMSKAGVGNVVAGNALYDLGKEIIKLGAKEENKPATKGEMLTIKNQVGQNKELIKKLIEKLNENLFYNL